MAEFFKTMDEADLDRHIENRAFGLNDCDRSYFEEEQHPSDWMEQFDTVEEREG